MNFKLYKLVAVFLGAILLSIIGLGRGAEEGSMFKSAYQSYKEGAASPTEELASSVRIMYRALEYFPHKIGFLNGLQFLLGLAGMFPFMSELQILDYCNKKRDAF